MPIHPNSTPRLCPICSMDIPLGSRSDKIYCSSKCKSIAWARRTNYFSQEIESNGEGYFQASGTTTYSVPLTTDTSLTLTLEQALAKLNYYRREQRHVFASLDYHSFLSLIWTDHTQAAVYDENIGEYIVVEPETGYREA